MAQLRKRCRPPPSVAASPCRTTSTYVFVHRRLTRSPACTVGRLGATCSTVGAHFSVYYCFFFLLPQFFDVDTDVVTARLRRALTPHVATSSFLESLDGKPDLYGPFWVCATLVFVVGVTSNIATWMNQDASAVRAPCRVVCSCQMCALMCSSRDACQCNTAFSLPMLRCW